jgi:energy-converting hydrogenase Eha subunit A
MALMPVPDRVMVPVVIDDGFMGWLKVAVIFVVVAAVSVGLWAVTDTAPQAAALEITRISPTSIAAARRDTCIALFRFIAEPSLFLIFSEIWPYCF